MKAGPARTCQGWLSDRQGTVQTDFNWSKPDSQVQGHSVAKCIQCCNLLQTWINVQYWTCLWLSLPLVADVSEVWVTGKAGKVSITNFSGQTLLVGSMSHPTNLKHVPEYYFQTHLAMSRLVAPSKKCPSSPIWGIIKCLEKAKKKSRMRYWRGIEKKETR